MSRSLRTLRLALAVSVPSAEVAASNEAGTSAESSRTTVKPHVALGRGKSISLKALTGTTSTSKTKVSVTGGCKANSKRTTITAPRKAASCKVTVRYAKKPAVTFTVKVR
jgi:hypothetical protein